MNKTNHPNALSLGWDNKKDAIYCVDKVIWSQVHKSVRLNQTNSSDKLCANNELYTQTQNAEKKSEYSMLGHFNNKTKCSNYSSNSLGEWVIQGQRPIAVRHFFQLSLRFDYAPSKPNKLPIYLP